MIESSAVRLYGAAADGTVYDTNDNTDGFHNFRVTYDQTADTYSIYRDGVELATGRTKSA